MKITPEEIKHAESLRADVIERGGERFISITDFKLALQDDAFIRLCMTMMCVGARLEASPEEITRQVIGCAVATLAGDIEEIRTNRN